MPNNKPDHEAIARIMQSVLKSEADQLSRLAAEMPIELLAAVDRLFACDGRVIVSGMGKMSAIARKTAATLCSVGTPAVFLHPSEALHGDLGVVSSHDVWLALSNSGETRDILQLVPFMKRHRVPIVSITCSKKNQLSKISDVAVPTGVVDEADSNTAAPTNSTTATLALCDSMAIALIHLRGFTAEQFAAFHPAGSLGRKLLLRVSDLMGIGSEIPLVPEKASLREAIVIISRGKMGAGFVVDSKNRLSGILTDGDLRRTLESEQNPLDSNVDSWMTLAPKTIDRDALAVSALNLMNDRAITVLPVVDSNGIVQGGLHLHDLLKAGLGQTKSKDE